MDLQIVDEGPRGGKIAMRVLVRQIFVVSRKKETEYQHQNKINS
jgi:hypothetical protein